MQEKNVSTDQLAHWFFMYQDMVYRIIRSRGASPVDVDDILQEVFLRLVRKCGSLQDDEHVKAWLIRVTLNCCNSHLGSRWKRLTVSYDDLVQKLPPAAVEAWQPQADPFLDSIGTDMSEKLYEAMQTLPAHYRDVVHLFYYEEMSVREISAVLQIRENAVKTRLTRARAKLSQYLQKGAMQR